TRSFTLGEGLAQRVAAADVPPATLGAALQALGARVDLQRDFNSGDTLYLVYRQRRDTRTGETWNGELLHVSWKPSQGSGLALYRYRDTDGRSAYYDRYGRSLESLLLRTPVDSSNVRLSSLFGKRKHPILGYTRMHRGVDFAAAWGTPVLAAGDGRMTVQRTDPELGNYLRIRHTAGISTGYAHLSVFAADVVAGDRVRQGQVVGYVGMSGLATGPHLHFEVFQDGVRVDPQQFNSTPKRVLEGEERLRFSALKNLLDQQVARHETGRSTATFAYFEAP
ncbi:MAG: M23 family metallopeptidase, partial [Ectothiorhodospiraceae bacterium]